MAISMQAETSGGITVEASLSKDKEVAIMYESNIYNDYESGNYRCSEDYFDSLDDYPEDEDRDYDISNSNYASYDARFAW